MSGWPQSDAAKAVAAAMQSRDRPKDGVVAVKVQYPDALPVMKLDLVSIRKWANFIGKTEIQFDLVSTVDELADQVVLEFDFVREARIMDTVSRHLKVRGLFSCFPPCMSRLTLKALSYKSGLVTLIKVV